MFDIFSFNPPEINNKTTRTKRMTKQVNIDVKLTFYNAGTEYYESEFLQSFFNTKRGVLIPYGKNLEAATLLARPHRPVLPSVLAGAARRLFARDYRPL